MSATSTVIFYNLALYLVCCQQHYAETTDDLMYIMFNVQSTTVLPTISWGYLSPDGYLHAATTKKCFKSILVRQFLCYSYSQQLFCQLAMPNIFISCSSLPAFFSKYYVDQMYTITFLYISNCYVLLLVHQSYTQGKTHFPSLNIP